MKILKRALLLVLIIIMSLAVGIYFWPHGPLRPLWEKISKQSPDNQNVLDGRTPATSTAVVSEAVFSPVTIKAYELDEDGGLVQRQGNYKGIVVSKSGLILILNDSLLRQSSISKEIVGLSVCPENDVSDCPYQAAVVTDDQVLNLALLQAIAVPGAGQEKEWPAMLPADAISKLAPWGQAPGTIATSTSADWSAWNEAGAVWVRAHLRSQPQPLPLAGPMNGFLKKQEILRQSDTFIDSRIGFSVSKPTAWKWYFESENRLSAFDEDSNSSLGINFYKFPYDASLEDVRLLAKHWAWETSSESETKVGNRAALRMQLFASDSIKSTINYFVPVGKYVVNFGFSASSTQEQIAAYEKVINSMK